MYFKQSHPLTPTHKCAPNSHTHTHTHTCVPKRQTDSDMCSKESQKLTLDGSGLSIVNLFCF